MIVTIELDFTSRNGTKSTCICERRWRPVVGYFWNVREVDSGDWRGFLDTEEIAELIMEQFPVRQINNAPGRNRL